jgi:hypothetical protein
VLRPKRNWTRDATFVLFQTYTEKALISVQVNEILVSKFRGKTATLIFAVKMKKKRRNSQNVKCILDSFYDFASLQWRKTEREIRRNVTPEAAPR